MEMEDLCYHIPGLLSEWHCNQIIDHYKRNVSNTKYEGSLNAKTKEWSESNFKVVEKNVVLGFWRIVHEYQMV